MQITNKKLCEELKIKQIELINKLQKKGLIDSNNKLLKDGLDIGGEIKKYMGNEYINWKDKDKIIQALTTSEKKVYKKSSNDMRKNFKAPEFRTEDGHYVRSKAEMIIDNWLYNKNITHAYEKRLPIEENLLSDFYIPLGKVYIEYWGYENQPKYLARKKTKQELYKKYEFNLIELQDKDVQNLDDILPTKLLKFGIRAF